MIRQPAILVAVAIVLLSFAGCTKTPPTGTNTVPPPGMMANAPSGGAPAAAGKDITILMVPKIKGIDYFNACEKGFKEAATELGGINPVFDGPTTGDNVDRQIQLIDGNIAQNTSVIAVSPNDPDSISPVLKKARSKGIHVVTFDADADPAKSGREFFVNQASAEAVGTALVDEMAAQAGPAAKVAIVTSSLTAANQNAWIRTMKAHMAAKYPKMTVVTDPKPTQEDQQVAFQVTQDLLKTYPDLKGIFAITSVSFPGAAEAVKAAKLSGKIAVVGLATPKPMRQWVEDGTVKTVILWNPVDLGYLVTQVAKALADGTLVPGATSMKAGRLGTVEVKGDQVLLGPPMRFTKDNIAQYDF